MARYALDADSCRNFALSSRREWLLTNGIGGFAMGTVAGVNSRRYHGLLVAATQPPAHRVVLVPNLDVEVRAGDRMIGLSANQYQGAVHPTGFQNLVRFEVGEFAHWEYEASGFHLSKSVALTPGENTTTVRFVNHGPKSFALTVRPLVSHKFYHANFVADPAYPSQLDLQEDRTVVTHEGVDLHLVHAGWSRETAVGWYYRFENLREVERGLDPRDDAYCPCVLTRNLAPEAEAILVFSDHGMPMAYSAWDQGTPTDDLGERLAAATSKYLVKTRNRTSILAGYPWFTDWGRDTMISLPGICLETGRLEEARQMIRSFASQMRHGLIPNRFVEHGEIPEYNTADATLWFVNAIYLTLQKEWDEAFARELWPKLVAFFEAHMRGTKFGIGIDTDGLLTQGEESLQLTWMDAKLGDWVVTPRRGKAVELNGLWINACRVLAWLGSKLGEEPQAFAGAAEQAEGAFHTKFWRDSLGHYLDVVDPDDASLRPNQVFAISLPFGPARGEPARRALNAVREHLLTPVGLRTLAPDSLYYRPRFRGPLQELDAAYHQGTVWPWLIGAYAEAELRLGADPAEILKLLENAAPMLTECGLGGLAEVYDGDEPREPAGCPWQAWSVAEWYRAWRLASGQSSVVE